MPVREEKEPVKSAPKKQAQAQVSKDPIDIEFLPENLQKRIRDMFDTYFGFGFKMYSQTMDEGEVANFPNKISALTSEELGDLQSKYTSWLSYTLEKLRYVSVAAMVVEQELDNALNRAIVTIAISGDKKLNVEEKKAQAKQDDGYMTILSYRMKLDGIKKLLDDTSKQYDKCVTSASREIARRERVNGWT